MSKTHKILLQVPVFCPNLEYRKFTLDAPGVKVLNPDITLGANAENGVGFT